MGDSKVLQAIKKSIQFYNFGKLAKLVNILTHTKFKLLSKVVVMESLENFRILYLELETLKFSSDLDFCRFQPLAPAKVAEDLEYDLNLLPYSIKELERLLENASTYRQRAVYRSAKEYFRLFKIAERCVNEIYDILKAKAESFVNAFEMQDIGSKRESLKLSLYKILQHSNTDLMWLELIHAGTLKDSLAESFNSLPAIEKINTLIISTASYQNEPWHQSASKCLEQYKGATAYYEEIGSILEKAADKIQKIENRDTKRPAIRAKL